MFVWHEILFHDCGVLVDVRLVVLESRFVAFDVVDEGINVSVSIEHLGDGPSTFLRWCVEDDGSLDGWYDCEVHVY